MPKYNVNSLSLGYTSDCDGEFTYELDSHGENLSELIENASISRIGRDGDSVSSEAILEYGAYSSEAIEFLERLTGETLENTETFKAYAANQAAKRAARDERHRIQLLKPCEGCGATAWRENADVVFQYGDLCVSCHVEKLKTCFHCGEANDFFDAKLGGTVSTTCRACLKKQADAVATCEVCYETKPRGNACFFKFPDAGPGGNDIDGFCCDACGENPIKAWLQHRVAPRRKFRLGR